jgi:hypothetical protein
MVLYLVIISKHKHKWDHSYRASGKLFDRGQINRTLNVFTGNQFELFIDTSANIKTLSVATNQLKQFGQQLPLCMGIGNMKAKT